MDNISASEVVKLIKAHKHFQEAKVPQTLRSPPPFFHEQFYSQCIYKHVCTKAQSTVLNC